MPYQATTKIHLPVWETIEREDGTTDEFVTGDQVVEKLPGDTVTDEELAAAKQDAAVLIAKGVLVAS